MSSDPSVPVGGEGRAGCGRASWVDRIIRFCLENKLVVALCTLFVIGWGLRTAPFDWNLGGFPRNPVPVDAIPDLGENQQIVFTEWEGRSPQDVEDQITYPLTVSLLGTPGVKTIRSYSMFGFSTIYVIFEEKVDFYWSRSRVLEKLAALPEGTLPAGVRPTLGPDATGLGQVFWYTLEGRDEQGRPTGGWDLHELRTLQDWYVRYALLSAPGVAEVASIGGHVQEYQVDVDPAAMRAHRVTLEEVVRAVQMSNLDGGARTIEINNVEYAIRGVGFVKSVRDLEEAVVTVNENVPLRVRDVAVVTLGPAERRGVLDKQGAEVVGGVVVVRYGANPLAAIREVKNKIAEIAPSLPHRALPDGTASRVTIVPFYDRTGLIYETLETLNAALFEEILITIIVVVVMVRHLRSSILIAGLLPLAVLMTFIAMRVTGVDANIVALSGIAIAIGTLVDMGIIICENILTHLRKADPRAPRLEVVYRAASEVGGAVLAAVATTIVGFLPVLTMEGVEGKLFKPLAYTKTFALTASVIVALTVIPAAAHLVLARDAEARQGRRWAGGGVLLAVAVAVVVVWQWWWLGLLLTVLGGYAVAAPVLPTGVKRWLPWLGNVAVAAAMAVVLTQHWLPIGPEHGLLRNLVFVVAAVGGLLLFLELFRVVYPYVLRWALGHKVTFLMLPLGTLVLGALIWRGHDGLLGWLPAGWHASAPARYLAGQFPGLGKEFMPPLDEGSYLYMPVTMPHASISEVVDVLQKQDLALARIPEVESAVGKLGRVESALDPAPLSMIETVINYHPEFLTDAGGRRLLFRCDPADTDWLRTPEGQPVLAPDGEPYRVRGKFARDERGALIADPHGYPFRLWRPALDPALNDGRAAWPGVRRPDDIWDLIVEATRIPGTTSAPKLQPIAARIVMLQSGMRAPMGVKVKGPDLASIEAGALRIEHFLKQVEAVPPETVVADRLVGKPYLEIEIDRTAAARYGVMVAEVQEVIEVALGGRPLTFTVEGRERFPVRVRYPRELRDNLEALERVLVPAADGAQVPLIQLARINYVRGPEMIKSEDTFLVGYVLFDRRPGYAEVDVVEQVAAFLQEKRQSGELALPDGVSYSFAGTYENQVRSEKKLMVVLPLSLFIIFVILYLQFRSVLTTGMVFAGIIVAWAGGFILIWCYNQPWFLDVTVLGVNLREVFQVHPINLSVAIWVGFLALFGIAEDDGVVMTTYLESAFAETAPTDVAAVRAATLEGASRRVRPCLMTTGTTILALLPVLTSTGRGADIMVPMAIPSFGGMVIEIMTMLIVPVLYCALQERRVKARAKRGG
ncbi:MAG TPA: efflux RND transporter permease subunit [Phycisphaerae bacterium]|nr:efflux RND transporter permease subunit [Phycisphaerae bacterium]HNU45446.1 efflux RND transporter permease subunit [Phycisphaerae bacterium]